jgi:hypothetical protein
LSEYLGDINEIVGQRHLGTNITTTKKPFILSVTGTPDEIEMAYALIANAAEMDEDLRLCMEVKSVSIYPHLPQLPFLSKRAASNADHAPYFIRTV